MTSSTANSAWFSWALLSAVIAAAFLGERPSVQEWVGIAMVGADVLVLAHK